MAFESNVLRCSFVSHRFSLPSLTASALLLAVLLLMVETNAALLLKLPTLPPPKTFYNGTYASLLCEATFRCDTSSRSEMPPACSCHPNCSLYDACCEDVRPGDWRRRALPPVSYECAVYPSLVSDASGNFRIVAEAAHVFLITKCPRAFEGSCLARLCDSPTGGASNDKLSFAWVSDRSTGVTYRNKFCALCHGLAEEEMTFWSKYYGCIDEPGVERLGLSGCEHNVMLMNDFTSKLPRCSGPYYSRCPNASSQLMQEACTDSPARYIYDYNSFTTYRNYNCSLCDSSSSNRAFRCIPLSMNLPISVTIDATLVSGFSGCISKRMACDADDERYFIKELCIATDTVTHEPRLWAASINASTAPGRGLNIYNRTFYAEFGVASESTRLLPVTLPVYVLSALALIPASID